MQNQEDANFLRIFHSKVHACTGRFLSPLYLRSTKYILFTRNHGERFHAERFYLSIPIDRKNTQMPDLDLHMADDTLVVSSAVNVLMSFVLDQVNLHPTNFKPALPLKGWKPP